MSKSHMCPRHGFHSSIQCQWCLSDPMSYPLGGRPEDLAERDRLRAEVEALRADVELHKSHWTEAREERNKIRAWLCEKGYDAEYEKECDVPGCPKAWEAELADLRARLPRVVAALKPFADVGAEIATVPPDLRDVDCWTDFMLAAHAVLAEEVGRG